MSWYWIVLFNYVTILIVLLTIIIKEKSGRNKFVDILHCFWLSIIFSLLPFLMVMLWSYTLNKSNEYKKALRDLRRDKEQNK